MSFMKNGLLALSIFVLIGCAPQTGMPGAVETTPPFEPGEEVSFVLNGDKKAIVTYSLGGDRYRIRYFDTVGVYQWTDVEKFEIEKL